MAPRTNSPKLIDNSRRINRMYNGPLMPYPTRVPMMTPETPSGLASAIEMIRLRKTAIVTYAVTARTRPMPTNMVVAIVAVHVTN